MRPTGTGRVNRDGNAYLKTKEISVDFDGKEELLANHWVILADWVSTKICKYIVEFI